MTQMLRGTVYVVFEGVPVRRRVLEILSETPEQFRAAARTRLVGAGLAASLGLAEGAATTFEFGPIGPSWGPR
jgi:hypothetical protein